MSKKTMFAEIKDRTARIEALKANSRSTTKMEVPYFFSETELRDMREEATSIATQIDEKEEEKAEMTKALNEQIKPLKKNGKRLRKEIKAGHVKVEKELYEYDNQVDRKMEYYDADGNLAFERDLAPHEFQTRILPMAANNG